jgi:DNA polymerase-3 subunit epsilon
MQNIFNNLTASFRKNNGRLSFNQFEVLMQKNTMLFTDTYSIFLILQSSGYPIEEDKNTNEFILVTMFRDYKTQKFCILDIETNGSKPTDSQVIEIGAMIVQDGKIIDKFETFVNCTYLPSYITKITNIEIEDLMDAPPIKDGLLKLKLFMKDSIFVAHNVSFDFSFLNHSFERFGLGSIGNIRLCTIDLAKRTFESPKYGLAYLNELLNIDSANHHRAYSDAYSAYVVMQKSLETIPDYVKTTDELVQFTVSNRKSRKFQAKG